MNVNGHQCFVVYYLYETKFTFPQKTIIIICTFQVDKATFSTICSRFYATTKTHGTFHKLINDPHKKS